MPKGSKQCPDCSKSVGVRTKTCDCGYKFLFKPSLKKKRGKLVKDCRELEKGDEIKIIQGSGSYAITQNGEKVYFTERGRLKVNEKQNDGLCVYGKHGFSFLYMGEPMYCMETNTYRNPHKLKLLKKTNG